MLKGYSVATFSMRASLYKAANFVGWDMADNFMQLYLLPQSIISKGTYTEAQRVAVVCSAHIHKAGVSQLQRSDHCVLSMFYSEWCWMLEAKHLRAAFQLLVTLL